MSVRLSDTVAISGSPSPEYKPYWWDAAPPESAPLVELGQLYDVGIIGAGLTGLSAAIPLVRAGRSVVLLEREVIGSGASRRNAGFLGRSLKRSITEISGRKGPEFAKGVYRELDEAYQSTMKFIRDENIACHVAQCGRFIGAPSRAHLAELERDLHAMKELVGLEFSMLNGSSVRTEVDTDRYVGGAVIADLGSLHPGLYHAGLTRLALDAGATICAETEVLRVQEASAEAGHSIFTNRGKCRVRDVIVATNGYTTSGLSWHRRRVLPFTGYMAATERLPEDLLHKLLPNRRTVLGSNVNIDFFRPAPDQPRLLWGGATGSGIKGPKDIASRLRGILLHTFPQLATFKTTHVWDGQCAGTFDFMPHIGGKNRVWYAMGYNFAGVPMGSHLGRKLAAKIMGQAEAQSYFDSDPFPTWPFYRGNAWFMPLVMRYFDYKDRRLARSLK